MSDTTKIQELLEDIYEVLTSDEIAYTSEYAKTQIMGLLQEVANEQRNECTRRFYNCPDHLDLGSYVENSPLVTRHLTITKP